MKFGNSGAIGAIALGVLLAGGPAIGKGFIKDSAMLARAEVK